jgi:hypothetical protein
VVVEHGVHERGVQHGVAVGVAAAAGGVGTVPLALRAAHIAPAAVVGDVAQLLHIDIQQRTRGVVLVAADRLPGGPVDVGQPVEPAVDQHRVHRRGGQAEPVGDLHRTEALLPPQVHDLAHHGPRVPRGQQCGRELRSAIAVGPPLQYRWAHMFAVGHETLNTAAA